MRHVLTSSSETIEDDFAALQRALADSPRLQSLTAPDVCAFWAQTPHLAVNVVADARIAEDRVSTRVPEILQPFLERRLPFQWLTTPGTTTPALEAALASAGLRAREFPAMHASLRTPVDPAAADDVYIDVVWPGQLTALDAPLFNTFGQSLESSGEQLDVLETLDPTAHHFFVARSLSNGEVLGSSAMFTHAGNAMLTHVSCLPQARGRGIERALIATMMNRASSTGASSVSMIANHATYPTFLELGFRTEFNLVAWVWQPPL